VYSIRRPPTEEEGARGALLGGDFGDHFGLEAGAIEEL